jgi:hypothetical protein
MSANFDELKVLYAYATIEYQGDGAIAFTSLGSHELPSELCRRGLWVR